MKLNMSTLERLKDNYIFLRSQTAFGCQPAFKSSTLKMVDPFLCMFSFFFAAHLFSRSDGKNNETLKKMMNEWKYISL